MAEEIVAKPVYVPMAMPLQEAEATFRALDVAFKQLAFGQIRPPGFSDEEMKQIQGVYARAMVTVGEAIDKAREGSANA